MSTLVKDEDFAKALTELGLVPAERLEEARKTQGDAPLGEALVKSGALTEEFRQFFEDRIAKGVSGPLKKLGEYVLVRKLGEGGMGAVFEGILLDASKASDEGARRVAIKILKKELTENNPKLVDRFLREARSAVELQHPNVVSALGAGEDDGYHFYVMQFYEGEPLDQTLKRDKKLPWERALDVILDAARGLEYAHGLNFIHRDIKPANIYLCKDGPAKLLDFGLVKNLETSGQEALTAPGTMMGSPHYISPEQVRAEAELTGQTDIYSLGATFYHVATGRPPFQGDSAATIILAHISQIPQSPKSLEPAMPDGMSQVILKMMAKERKDRYASCTAIVEDLTLVKEGKAPKLAGGAAPAAAPGAAPAEEASGSSRGTDTSQMQTVMLGKDGHPLQQAGPSPSAGEEQTPAWAFWKHDWWKFWKW